MQEIKSINLQSTTEYSSELAPKKKFIISAIQQFSDNVLFHGIGYTVEDALTDLANQATLREYHYKQFPTGVGIAGQSISASKQ